MTSFFGLLKRVLTAANPPASHPNEDSRPIKFGILGAAAIAPLAIISPAKNHPEAVIYAIAARDKNRAIAYGKKYGIQKIYGGSNGYQELLDDPEVEAVYNPLPNGLHYEWTMKALAAGKHVLLEKPSADTAEETRQMFSLAEQKGLVLLEAFHYRFHPAIQRAKAIITSGELGAIKHISATLTVPKGFVKDGDIRYNYDLGGGGLMDMGCYTMNCIRYLASSDPLSVISAEHDLYTPPSAQSGFKPSIDRGTTATLLLPGDTTATLRCDLSVPYSYGIIPSMPQITTVVKCEGGELELYNFVMPTIYHSLTIAKKDGKSIKTRTEKIYTFADAKMEGKGEAWWTTYRYQLEAFVDQVKGRTPQTWVEKEDSVANIDWIQQIYEKIGLGSRPASVFTSHP